MIFKPELAEKILREEKTATRRRMSDNPRSPWYREKCGYRVGQVFAVQPGRSEAGIGKARVTAVYQQHLVSANVDDARREGFQSTLAFRQGFSWINRGFDPEEIVWVVEFELVEEVA